jgi:hypothetical protein
LEKIRARDEEAVTSSRKLRAEQGGMFGFGVNTTLRARVGFEESF